MLLRCPDPECGYEFFDHLVKPNTGTLFPPCCRCPFCGQADYLSQFQFEVATDMEWPETPVTVTLPIQSGALAGLDLLAEQYKLTRAGVIEMLVFAAATLLNKETVDAR